MKHGLKTLLFVVLLCSQTVLYAQTPKKTQVHVDKNSKTYNWALSNDGCWGCASFFWKIEREIEPDAEGFYNYEMAFSSNSFYSDKSLTSTYVSGIKITFIDATSEYLAAESFYQLIPPNEKRYKKFGSKDPQQVIKVTWDPVKLLNK